MQFLLFFSLIFIKTNFAQTHLIVDDPLTNPTMSLRCREMFQERQDKMRVQQKLSSLWQRNLSLQKKTPKQKESVMSRLKSNEVKVKNELYLAELKVKTLEESIVRSGCPGLSL